MVAGEIPERLRKNGIRFVLLKPKDKIPIQPGWQKMNIEYNNTGLLRHIHNGGNYGVIGGGIHNLLILDFDNLEVQNEVCQKLPETFTVKTGTGKLHKYFF